MSEGKPRLWFHCSSPGIIEKRPETDLKEDVVFLKLVNFEKGGFDSEKVGIVINSSMALSWRVTHRLDFLSSSELRMFTSCIVSSMFLLSLSYR